MQISFPNLKYNRLFTFLSSLGLFFISLGSVMIVVLLYSAQDEKIFGLKVIEIGMIITSAYLLTGLIMISSGAYLWKESPYRQKNIQKDKADQAKEKERKENHQPTEATKEENEIKDEKSPRPSIWVNKDL